MRKLAAITLGVALAATATVALAGRNSSGTYSLPSGNPVVGGTQITSAWANNTLGDLAQGVTDSLDRTGRGGMVAPLRVPNGTVTAPTLSFSNETNSGWYRQGSGAIRLAVGGVDSLQCTNAGVTVPGTLGVTGASTFTGLVTANGGATVATGDVTISTGALLLTRTGNQLIVKTGGTLLVGTQDANPLQLQASGVSYWQVEPTVGHLQRVGAGSNTITGLPSPSAPDHAATKGYVDGTDGSAGVVAGTNVTITSALVTKSGSSVIMVRALLSPSTTTAAGTPRFLMTLPAGYRPTTAPTVTGLLYDVTTRALGHVTAQSDGQVFTNTGVTAGDSYTFSLAYSP